MGNVAQGTRRVRAGCAQGGKSAQGVCARVRRVRRGVRRVTLRTLRRPAQGSRCGTKTGPFWFKFG